MQAQTKIRPSIRDTGVIRRIANAYVLQSLSESKAMISVGYANAYASQNSKRIFSTNLELKREILRLQAKNAENTAYTVKQAELEYELARQLAMKVNQPAAAATAITGKARLYGMDKDVNLRDEVVIMIVAPAESEDNSPKRAESEVLND